MWSALTFLCVAVVMAGNGTLCKEGWTQTHGNSPTCLYLGWKACTTTPSHFHFLMPAVTSVHSALPCSLPVSVHSFTYVHSCRDPNAFTTPGFLSPLSAVIYNFPFTYRYSVVIYEFVLGNKCLRSSICIQEFVCDLTLLE